MNFRKNRHIFLSAALLMALFAGCADEPLYDSPADSADPNAVKFASDVRRAVTPTRAAETGVLYEPLELMGEGDTEPLYLHTYESDKVGFVPGEETETSGAQSRGMQVVTVEDLEKYHKDFAAHASFFETQSDYIAWTGTHAAASGSNIWLANGSSRYWPSDRKLAFHAVAPSKELDNLVNLQTGDNQMTFTYSAKKSDGTTDAEAQTDLIVATSACNKAGSIDGRAPLKFHHALSAVKFAVRDILGGEVVNIKIANVYGTASCLYTADESGDNGTFLWASHESKQTYSQDFNYKVDDRIVNPSDDTQDILLNETMPEKTFMLIPQLIPDDAEIIVTLKRTGMTPETKVVRAKIKANEVTEWKAGHEYVYTISTSKDNWVYIFKATGNHNPKTGKHNVDGTQIYVYSPSKEEHDTYHDDAYFNVISCRYRANNMSVLEPLPWSASHNDALQYFPSSNKLFSDEAIPAEKWITDPKELKGTGSKTTTEKDRHDIVFLEHHQTTDWNGDLLMQRRKPYSGNSAENYWDLSTCGGKLSRSTANCYIVDREGYYCFPLVYGNSVTKGQEITTGYTFTGGLKSFYAHSGRITSAYITGGKWADIVWSDVYNAISDVKLQTLKIDGKDEQMITFHVNKGNLQQGNVIIALYDKKDGTVLWSWHIWITEHWLSENGRPHALAKNNKDFDFEADEQSGRRERGDVLVTADGINDKNITSAGGGFKASYSTVKKYMAPYNLGWCDPKNVDYLRRPGEMKFVQYQKDGVTPTGNTAELSILQEGEHVSYKFGNTTYYQFGRKDPMVGFVDHSNTIKRNFGPKEYAVANKSGVSVADGIKNPHLLYASGSWKIENWQQTGTWYNLWNNDPSAEHDYGGKTVVKTVYDPCPPGYVVPPASIFCFIGKNDKGKYDTGGASYNEKLTNFNGIAVDDYTFKIHNAGNKNDKNDANFVWFSATGNRWYTDKYKDDPKNPIYAMNGGDNFNSHIVYLWSCTRNAGVNVWGLALGKDEMDDTGKNKYVISPYFIGRMAMGRPVRPVRE